MRTLATEKNLFELLSENGVDTRKAANILNVRVMAMSVYDYMERYERGGLRHKYFAHLEEICENWCLEQLENQAA